MNRTKAISMTGAAMAVIAASVSPAAAVNTYTAFPKPAAANAPASAATPQAAASPDSTSPQPVAPSNGGTAPTADTAPNGIITTLDNSDSNYLDDTLRWDNDISAWSVDGSTKYCVPADTRLLGRHPAPDQLTFGPSNGGTTAAKPYVAAILNPHGHFFGLLSGPQEAHSCRRMSNGNYWKVGYSAAGAPVALGSKGTKPLMILPDGTLVAVDGTGKLLMTDADGSDNGSAYLASDGSQRWLGAGNTLLKAGTTAGTYTQVTDAQDKPVTITALGSDALPTNTLAYVDADIAKDASYRSGFDFGILAVPFKYQMTGQHSFSSSATLGGYIGYRVPMGDSGLVISPVAFAGASNISVPSTSDPSQSQTMAGFSYGGGFVTSVKDSVQVGIIVGFDHVDAPNYAYNDKPWLSLEVGYSFAK